MEVFPNYTFGKKKGSDIKVLKYPIELVLKGHIVIEEQTLLLRPKEDRQRELSEIRQYVSSGNWQISKSVVLYMPNNISKKQEFTLAKLKQKLQEEGYHISMLYYLPEGYETEFDMFDLNDNTIGVIDKYLKYLKESNNTNAKITKK